MKKNIIFILLAALLSGVGTYITMTKGLSFTNNPVVNEIVKTETKTEVTYIDTCITKSVEIVEEIKKVVQKKRKKIIPKRDTVIVKVREGIESKDTSLYVKEYTEGLVTIVDSILVEGKIINHVKHIAQDTIERVKIVTKEVIINNNIPVSQRYNKLLIGYDSKWIDSKRYNGFNLGVLFKNDLIVRGGITLKCKNCFDIGIKIPVPLVKF